MLRLIWSGTKVGLRGSKLSASLDVLSPWKSVQYGIWMENVGWWEEGEV